MASPSPRTQEGLGAKGVDAGKVTSLRTELLNFIRAEGEIHRIGHMLVITLAWIAVFVVTIVILNVETSHGESVRAGGPGARVVGTWIDAVCAV
jgi:hypothetical protein